MLGVDELLDDRLWVLGGEWWVMMNCDEAIIIYF